MSYFSDVFLCLSNDGKNFECKQFKSFLEAEEYYERNCNTLPYQHVNHKATMIPMCKLMPTKLQEYFINRQLEQMYDPFFRTKITKN